MINYNSLSGKTPPPTTPPLARDDALLRGKMPTMPAALLRVRSPNVIGRANRYTPSPLLRRRCSCCVCVGGGGLVACPAWSAPPPPAVGIAQLARGCCGALLVCLGAAAPPLPRPAPRPRGGGGILLGFAHACNAALSGRGLCALGDGLACGLRLLPCFVWARKARHRGYLSRLAAAPCCRLGASRPAPVLPLLSCPLPLAAAARYATLLYVPVSCSPCCKSISKLHQKTQKSVKKPAFCAAYRRKRPWLRQLTVR